MGVRFKKSVNMQTRDILLAELNDYEMKMPMNKLEREELYKWVASGNSPYASCYHFDSGWPMDYVSAIRFDRDIWEQQELEIPTQHDDCPNDSISGDDDMVF